MFNMIHFIAFDLFVLKREGAESDYSSEQIQAAKAYFEEADQVCFI